MYPPVAVPESSTQVTYVSDPDNAWAITSCGAVGTGELTVNTIDSEVYWPNESVAVAVTV